MHRVWWARPTRPVEPTDVEMLVVVVMEEVVGARTVVTMVDAERL
jgi:hypothetical protein